MGEASHYFPKRIQVDDTGMLLLGLSLLLASIIVLCLGSSRFQLHNLLRSVLHTRAFSNIDQSPDSPAAPKPLGKHEVYNVESEKTLAGRDRLEKMDSDRSGSSTPEAVPRSGAPEAPPRAATPRSLATSDTAPDMPSLGMPPPPVPSRSPKRLSPISSKAPSSTPRAPTDGSVLKRANAAPVNRTSTLLQPAAGLRAPTSSPTLLNPATGNAVSSARKKVRLAPGHSPLDWANLQRSGKNLSGVPFPQRVTPSQLAANNGRKGKPAWCSFQGKVYNLGPYLPFHPGGSGELMRAAGKGADKLFFDVHPWVNWENIMRECLVGFMVEEKPGVSPLDDMD